MRVALIAVDQKETHRQYDGGPSFHNSVKALIESLTGRADIEVHVVSCIQTPAVPSDRIENSVRLHSVHVPPSGWLRSGYLGCICRTRKKLQQLSPDIVHGHGTERYAAICAAFSGYPSLITIHGNMRRVARALQAKPFSFHWFTAKMERFVIPKVDAIVCPSHYSEDQVSLLNPKTWVIPNAVPSAFFNLQRRLEKGLILVVGDIVPYKNQIGFLKAIDGIAQNTGVRTVFVGQSFSSSPYTREFIELVRQTSWCQYKEYIQQEELMDYLTRAHIMVLPTKEDNCPMAVLEAMAAGVPVAASRVGGIPDIIADGVTGLLFDPDNPRDMCAAIEKLLQDPGYAVQLGEAARIDALKKYHPAVIAEQHITIYKQLIGSQRS